MKVKEKRKATLIKIPSVIVPLEEYEGWQETLEILSDNDLVKSIFKSLNESGERISHDKLTKSK
jgi:PHD/YefM family antitoxin component YafN of YafNO toxin-antitoxin module